MIVRNGLYVMCINGDGASFTYQRQVTSYGIIRDPNASNTTSGNTMTRMHLFRADLNLQSTESYANIFCSSSTTPVKPDDITIDAPIVDLVGVATSQYMKSSNGINERPYIEYSQNLKNTGDTAVTVNKVALYNSSKTSAYCAKYGEVTEADFVLIAAQVLDQPVIVQAGETKNFLIRLYMTD